MVNLAKMGLSLFIASTVSLMAQVSLAGDFDLIFDSSSRLSTVESHAVVRGDQDRYYFSAQEGRHISMDITGFSTIG